MAQKIVALPGAIGKFEYDVVKDESTCDEINRLMVGLESNVYSFADILDKVDVRSKLFFQEQTLSYRGSETTVESSPILLNNGNIITATYNMVFHEGMLAGITGESQLIKVA